MVNTLDHACRAACPAALGVARMGSKSEPDAVLDDVALPSFKKRIWARFTEDCNDSHIGNVLTAAWGEQRAIFKEAPVVHPPCCATWPLLATCVYLPRHANVVCACHTMPIWCVCVCVCHSLQRREAIRDVCGAYGRHDHCLTTRPRSDKQLFRLEAWRLGFDPVANVRTNCGASIIELACGAQGQSW